MPLFLLDKRYADFTSHDKYDGSLKLIIERLAMPLDGNSKTSFTASEVKFYIEQLEHIKSEFTITQEEKRLLLERLEKERQNIPSILRNAIDDENKVFPEFSDINRLYAFTTSFGTITAGYLLHGLRKEHIKGGPHQIAMICQLDDKTDELTMLMEATLTRISTLNKEDTDT